MYICTTRSTSGSSVWRSPACGAKPTWCDISTTLSCAFNFARMHYASKKLCANGSASSALLEPTKTKLVEFGRVAHRHASRHGRKRPETIYFLGFTLYCTRNLKGNFKVGMRTEKSRLRRSLMSLCDQMRQTRHLPIQEQVDALNLTLRGHYAYYGVAGNIRALQRVYRFVERYWRKMLCSRSWAGRHLTWAAFNRLKERVPLLRPRLRLPYRALQALVVL